jgi:pimeloyl-ACP methyl ester carboxylesterase
MTHRSSLQSRLFILGALLTTLFSSFAGTALAQTPCGNIIAPEYFFEDDASDVPITEAIADCSNPFEVTTDPLIPYTLEINDQVVFNGGEVTLVGKTTNNIDIKNTPINLEKNLTLFKHVGNDYVYTRLYLLDPTIEDFTAFAQTYFPTQTEADFYLNLHILDVEGGDPSSFYFDENQEPIIDQNTGETVFTRYSNFSDAANTALYGRKDSVGAGTYTLVVNLKEAAVIGQTWLNWLRGIFIPTAHAQYIQIDVTYAITFTLTELTPEPTGASSVLFLPGIQASRLYNEDGVGTTEDQLWEPNTNSDVEELVMTPSGTSVNDIYTKDVLDEIQGTANIYKGFLGMLEDLEEDEVIADSLAFAYDWRYSVEDIVLYGVKYEHEIKNLMHELESLASSSYTGKVTVIGHSNGGLLAKVLISALEEQGKANLVDKVVFIGTPHLGTPKALATVLHGYDQQKLGGAIINDSTARHVMKNMPGVYSLLPSQKYLEIANSPLINFLESSSTQNQINYFGSTIENVSEYKNFLNGLDGREYDFDNISAPSITNPGFLNAALALHQNQIDNWLPPAGVEVHAVVGVGLKTVASVEYREVVEKTNCTANVFGQIICEEPERFVRPYAHFTQDGDETVTSISADAVAGQLYYFNLEAYREGSLELNSKDHADFTEVSGVQDLIKNIINGTSTTIEYITDTKPEFPGEYNVITIDSPVQILAQDENGNKTGIEGSVIQKNISGSEYLEFGGTKYLILPRDKNVGITLKGEALGGYTLTTAWLRNNGQQVIETTLVDATTTPDMTAQLSFVNGEFTTIKTDYNNDGTVDLETSLDGEVIEVIVTYQTVKEAITDLSLSRTRKMPLLALLNLSEKLYQVSNNKPLLKIAAKQLLTQLISTIEVYKKRGYITESDRLLLVELIKELHINI